MTYAAGGFDAKLAPAGDQVVVPHACPVPFTGRPDQKATEVCVGEEWGYIYSTPMADGVHQAMGLEATGCRPRSFGRGERSNGRRRRVATREESKLQHESFWRATLS